MQERAEDAAEWMAHVPEQVQAETVFVQAAGQKFRIRQESHVTMSTALNVGQKWSEDRDNNLFGNYLDVGAGLASALFSVVMLKQK